MAVAQLGTAVEVGIGSYTYTGYTVTGVTGPDAIATVKTLKDEVGDTKTILTSDPGVKMQIVMFADSGSDPTSLNISDSITVNAVLYRLENISTQRGQGDQEVVVTMDLIKEDSMTYS